MGALVVIPARLGSTRFPAKVLACETGQPLVQHVVDRIGQCRRVSAIVVATDSERVVAALEPYGTRCVLTSPHHVSGTDRVAEVARGRPESIVINVQGDEPEIEPEVVDRLIERLERHDDRMVTAATPFPETANVADPNLVKVVRDQAGYALYFSRAAIPYDRDGQTRPAGGGRPPAEGRGPVRPYWLHVGLYGYRRDFLLTYASWPATPLEQLERLEQLRALENGVRLFVVEVERASGGIDTPEQYRAFVDRVRRLGGSGVAGGQRAAAPAGTAAALTDRGLKETSSAMTMRALGGGAPALPSKTHGKTHAGAEAEKRAASGAGTRRTFFCGE